MKAGALVLLPVSSVVTAGCVLVREPMKAVGTTAGVTVKTARAVARSPLPLLSRKGPERNDKTVDIRRV